MKKYNVIYVDPPWKYKQKSAGRGNKSGASDKYKTEDVSKLPVNQITEDNALIFMWATTPLLPDAFELLKTWGFTYKSMIVWEKTGLLGMGNWLRINTEFILIGFKGDVVPFKHQERNIYKHKVGRHSQKPHFFRELVSILALKTFNNVVKLEMFARTRDGMFGDIEYEGWDVYGDQCNNSIELPTIKP